MNGKLVVIGMAVAIGLVMTAAFLWPEGAEEDPAPPPAPAAAEPEPEEPKKDLRVTERHADGSLTITNVPEGAEDPVEEAKRRAAERLAERRADEGDARENPFRVFVDDGTPLTDEAMKLPRMADVEPASDDYDPVVEAYQRFHDYEADLLAAAPLDPETWKDVTYEHQQAIKDVFKRSKELVDLGYSGEARVLIEEWSELQNKYKAQAYGRSPQAFVEPDQ